jgi:hypothetical protein
VLIKEAMPATAIDEIPTAPATNNVGKAPDCLPCAVWPFILCFVVFDAFFTIAVMNAVFFGARTIRS